MAKRSLHIPFGNIEQVTTVVEELRKTVRFYEKLFGFVIERDARSPLRTEARPLVLKKRPRGLQLLQKLGEPPRFAKTINPLWLGAGLRRIAFKSDSLALDVQSIRGANGRPLATLSNFARRNNSSSSNALPALPKAPVRKRKLKQ